MQCMPQFSSHFAKETLGVHLAPDGNNKTTLKRLKLKTEAWKENIHVGHLNWLEAWYVLDATILQSLKYPLPAATTLSRSECNSIMKPVLDAGLPATSICHNFPRKVLYGSTDESGLGKMNLYIEQGLSKIVLIPTH